MWEATAKRSALSIRQLELNFHIRRYTVLIVQAGMLGQIALMGMIHLRHVPESTEQWISLTFFGAKSLRRAICCDLS